MIDDNGLVAATLNVVVAVQPVVDRLWMRFRNAFDQQSLANCDMNVLVTSPNRWRNWWKFCVISSISIGCEPDRLQLTLRMTRLLTDGGTPFDAIHRYAPMWWRLASRNTSIDPFMVKTIWHEKRKNEAFETRFSSIEVAFCCYFLRSSSSLAVCFPRVSTQSTVSAFQQLCTSS